MGSTDGVKDVATISFGVLILGFVAAAIAEFSPTGILIGLVIYLSLNLLLGLCFGYFSMTPSFIFYLLVAVVGARLISVSISIRGWQQPLINGLWSCAIFLAAGLLLNWVIYSREK